MRRVPNERQRLLAFTILAGGLGGLAAVAFHKSVAWLEGILIDRAAAGYATPASHLWILWTVLCPALGGLACGLGLYYLVPAAAGSGIPQVKVAFMRRSGFVAV